MGVFSSDVVNRVSVGSVQPENSQDGDIWSDSNPSPPVLKIFSTSAGSFINATGLTNLRADASFTSGEALAINELVMVDSTDNEVFKCTSAKAQQAIGVMLKAVDNSTAFSFQDCAIYGIVTMIAGGTIAIGDRLICDSGTAGRVIALNSDVLTHDHTAFTIASSSQSATAFFAVTKGSGGVMRDGSFQLGLTRCVNDAGAASLTCTTSADGPTLVHGRIIGKALAASTTGNTFRALLAQMG